MCMNAYKICTLWSMSAGHICLCETFILRSSVCSFISNKIKVKQEEDMQNDSRQQEGTQDNVDDSQQNMTKTLQDIKNVSIWIESI